MRRASTTIACLAATLVMTTWASAGHWANGEWVGNSIMPYNDGHVKWSPTQLADASDTAKAAESGRAKDSFVVSLANRDQMEAVLVSISGGKLVIHPAVAPETKLELPLERVEGIRRDVSATTGKPSEAQTLNLLDGSFLRGKLIRLEDEWVRFDLEEVGAVKLPRRAAANLDLVPQASTTVRGMEEQHVLMTRPGDVLKGGLRQEPDGTFVVSGGVVEARIPASSVVRVIFPLPKMPAEQPVQGEGEKPEAKKELLCSLMMRNGSMLCGHEPVLADGRLTFALEGGQKVEVPVAGIAGISFLTGNRPFLSHRVLVWGKFSDRPDEYRKTMEIVKQRLGTPWQIVENFSDVDDEFQRELTRAGVLLIPEMESGTPGEDIAAKMRPLVETFLRRGGRIVVLGAVNKDEGFFKSAGIIKLQFAGSNEGMAVPFTDEGRKMAAEVGETSFRTTNSTQFYTPDGTETVAWASGGIGAPVIARRVGLGWVIAMGMDYYESNEQTMKMLVHALTFR